MTNKIIIVGHGPSVMENPRGRVIDLYDTVIRMKFGPNNPTYFGTRTDIMGGSPTIAERLATLPGKRKWIFFDSRHDGIDTNVIYHNIPRMFPVGSLEFSRELCSEWDELYRNRRTPTDFNEAMVDSKSSDKLGERHLSQGFKALLYTAYFIKPHSVDLIGFDNLKTGKFAWSTTRGRAWTTYPKHRWDVEHKMLDDVAKRFQMEINFI